MVIRTHRYSETDFRYFYSILLLFLPFRYEDELMGGYSTYEEHYNAKLNTVEENSQKYNIDKSDLEILGCQNFQSNISKIDLNNFVAHHFSWNQRWFT